MAINYNRPIFNNPNAQQQQNFAQARQAGRTPIKRYNRLQGRLDQGGLSDDRISNINNRLNRMSNRFGFKAPAVTKPAPTPTTTSPDVQGQMQDVMKSLFPQTSTFNAKDYINQDMYNWQQKQGQAGLDKYYASRGLSASGAEAEGNRNFLDKLGADTQATAYELAQADASRRQQSADRFYGLLRDNADRKMQGQQNQFDNMYSMYNLMLSQNPLSTGYQAANQLGQNAMAGASGGGGGGGGSSYPAFQPQFPSGPDYSNANYYDIFGGAASNSGWLNQGMDFLNGLFS